MHLKFVLVRIFLVRMRSRSTTRRLVGTPCKFVYTMQLFIYLFSSFNLHNLVTHAIASMKSVLSQNKWIAFSSSYHKIALNKNIKTIFLSFLIFLEKCWQTKVLLQRKLIFTSFQGRSLPLIRFYLQWKVLWTIFIKYYQQGFSNFERFIVIIEYILLYFNVIIHFLFWWTLTLNSYIYNFYTKKSTSFSFPTFVSFYRRHLGDFSKIASFILNISAKFTLLNWVREMIFWLGT